MKKIRILLAALLVSATCLVAAPASSTAATTLTITCHRAPATCVAVGQLGPLFGVTGISAPGGAEALICLDAHCNSGALLVIRPGLLSGFATLGNLLAADLVLTGHALFVDVLTHNIFLTLFGNNGAVGVLLLTPGRTVCLGLDHLKLFTTGC